MVGNPETMVIAARPSSAILPFHHFAGIFDKQQQDVCDLGSKGRRPSLAGEDAAGRVQTESPKLIAAPPLPDSYDAPLQHQADHVEGTDSLVSITRMMAAAPVPPPSFQVSTEREG
jgi:hypothetical protein